MFKSGSHQDDKLSKMTRKVQIIYSIESLWSPYDQPLGVPMIARTPLTPCTPKGIGSDILLQLWISSIEQSWNPSRTCVNWSCNVHISKYSYGTIG